MTGPAGHPGAREVAQVRAEFAAAVDRWDAALGTEHPDEVEARYQQMNQAGVRAAEVADAYPDAWWAAEATEPEAGT